MNSRSIIFLFTSLLIAFLCISSCSEKASDDDVQEQTDDMGPTDDTDDTDDTASLTPLFANSIVSTDIDFITSKDLDAFESVAFLGREDKEMPDSRTDDLFDTDTFVFEATFSNDHKVEVWAHSDFITQEAAQEYVDKLTPRLGKLPEFMRDILSHVVLHKGDAGAFAESEANFFVLYSDNMDTRISNNDLEETVFHETVHASLDAQYLDTSAWMQAQNNDDIFITDYAEENPTKEDLAESAIFVYTMLTHPNRLDASVENWVTENIPNRFAFIEAIFE